MDKDVKSYPVPCYMCGQRVAVYDSKDGVPVCDRCAPELQPELQPEVKNEEVSDKTPVTGPKTYRGRDVKISFGGKKIKGIGGADLSYESYESKMADMTQYVSKVGWDDDVDYDDVKDAIQYAMSGPATPEAAFKNI